MRRNLKFSIKHCSRLKPTRTPTSLSLSLFVNNKPSTKIGSFSIQKNFNIVSVEFKTLKKLLKQGLRLDPRFFPELKRFFPQVSSKPKKRSECLKLVNIKNGNT